MIKRNPLIPLMNEGLGELKCRRHFVLIWAGRGAVSGRKFIFNSKLLHKMLKIMKEILNMSKIVDVR